MRIYQADVWCDACGEAIEESLRAEGKAPEDTWDEASYDSDDYPKWGRDDDEADMPQHCAARDMCLAPLSLSGPDGPQLYGAFLHNALTTDGLDYVRAAIHEAAEHPERDSRVVRYWADMYEDVACGSPCPWEYKHPCLTCGRPVGKHDCGGTGRHEDCEAS